MQNLKDKCAIVTGSTSGIGLGIAEALAGRGAKIVLNGFGERSEIESLRESIAGRHQVTVHYSDADLTRSEQVEKLVVDANRRLGAVDILVNNAGIQHTDRIENFPIDRWDAIIALNLSAAFHTIRAVIPGMRRRGWGRIVNIASVHGLVASKNKSAYIAAKHGLVGLTKAVALENADLPITCNAICPGWVLTHILKEQIRQLAEEESIDVEEAKGRILAEKHPSKNAVTPEQIGELTAFLCSESAGEIRGATLPIDGGWTAV